MPERSYSNAFAKSKNINIISLKLQKAVLMFVGDLVLVTNLHFIFNVEERNLEKSSLQFYLSNAPVKVIKTGTAEELSLIHI